jgi:IclR family mhp operon transcriptional activator
VLRTASGRAYLAFCPDAERREIIEYLRTRNDPDDEPYLIPGAIEKIIATCRRNGFATRLNEAHVPKTSSVAVPILVNGYARGCITIVWLTSAMTATRAIKQFVQPLREAAETVSKRVASALWALSADTSPPARRRKRKGIER